MVFGYALSRAELRRAALSRPLPSGPARGAAPLDRLVVARVRAGAPTVCSRAPAAAARLPRGRARTARRAARRLRLPPRRRRRRPGRDGAGSAALQFITTLDGAQGADAVLQLRTAYPAHSAQVTALEAALAAMPTPTAAAEQRLLTARDARRRGDGRARRGARRGDARGAARPRQRAAREPAADLRRVDPERGVYHAFAIYELRAAAGGGVEGPWHVTVSDVFNMRQLLPQQDSWLPNVRGSSSPSSAASRAPARSSSPSRPSGRPSTHLVLRGD